MSLPPITDLQSFLFAKDQCKLGTPGADKAIKAAVKVIEAIPKDISNGCRLGDGSNVIKVALQAALAPPAVNPPHTPSVEPLQPSSLQGEAGNSNSQTHFTPFHSEAPISQPPSPPPLPEVLSTHTGMDKATKTPKAMGIKPQTPQALPVGDKLLVFDIHNSFHKHWFISQNHLMANTTSAQKDKDRKIFWVEFSPLYHTHLVKCAIVLVPHPLHKVKKVMFTYILELLNGEGPQAFFDLTKGQWKAMQA
jgi:hypothetical protein